MGVGAGDSGFKNQREGRKKNTKKKVGRKIKEEEEEK